MYALYHESPGVLSNGSLSVRPQAQLQERISIFRLYPMADRQTYGMTICKSSNKDKGFRNLSDTTMLSDLEREPEAMYYDKMGQVHLNEIESAESTPISVERPQPTLDFMGKSERLGMEPSQVERFTRNQTVLSGGRFFGTIGMTCNCTGLGSSKRKSFRMKRWATVDDV